MTWTLADTGLKQEYEIDSTSVEMTSLLMQIATLVLPVWSNKTLSKTVVDQNPVTSGGLNDSWLGRASPGIIYPPLVTGFLSTIVKVS